MDRILTTHPGSIVRPPWLRADRIAIACGEPYDRERYEVGLRAAVTDVVKAQAEVGLDIVNDGEYTKLHNLDSINDRMGGIEPRTLTYDPEEVRKLIPQQLREEVARRTLTDIDPEIAGSFNLLGEIHRFNNFTTTKAGGFVAGDDGLGWYCTGPIVYDPTQLDEDMALLTDALSGVDVAGAFVGSLSPASIAYLSDEYYGDEQKFIEAIADALGAEYRRIIDAGFDLQIDDAVMWQKYSTIRLAGGTPEDYTKWANLRIDAMNAALEGIPLDKIRYHICSGSSHSAKVIDAFAPDILPSVLRVKWGQLLFEQGNVVHEDEWGIWEDVELPEDRILVPGVITHHTHMVERPELVAQRIVRLANIVGRERVMAGADCGFDWSRGPRSEPWTQWAKFNALTEGAERASEQLWKKS